LDGLVDVDASLLLKPKDPSLDQPRPISGAAPSMKDMKNRAGQQGFNPF
jgi:hypothetical protein